MCRLENVKPSMLNIDFNDVVHYKAMITTLSTNGHIPWNTLLDDLRLQMVQCNKRAEKAPTLFIPNCKDRIKNTMVENIKFIPLFSSR